ncbi:hypothetical protein J6590_089674, partial [Homalodisca vitripennis]
MVSFVIRANSKSACDIVDIFGGRVSFRLRATFSLKATCPFCVSNTSPEVSLTATGGLGSAPLPNSEQGIKNNNMPLVYNIWQRSIKPDPLKSSKRRRKKHFSSNLVQDELKHRDSPVGGRYSSAGRARAFNFGLPVVSIGQTRRT